MKKLFLIIIVLSLLTGNCFAQKIDILTKEAGKEIYKITRGEDNDEIIIGDEKNPLDFKPQITFTKWKDKNGVPENILTLKPSGYLALDLADLDIPKPEFLNGQIKIKEKKGKIGFYFSPASDNVDNFKFGLILYSAPDPKYLTPDGKFYQFEFQLGGWEEFNFFYQPPLVNINPDGSTWEGGTQEKPENYRPADVNGSYAVYHKTKANYAIGGINYKTGKYCHIYRPKIIDANGNWIWATIYISNGNYIVSIPQSFLASAVYPVKANDTYGSTAQGASENSMATKDTSLNVSGTMPANGTITAISYWLRYFAVNQTVKVNYYGNDNIKSSGADSERTDIGNSDNTQHSYTHTITGDAENAGDKCAVGIKWNGFNPSHAYDATAGVDNAWVAAAYYTYADAIPATKVSVNAQQNQYSVWLTYTPSGGGGGRRRMM